MANLAGQNWSPEVVFYSPGNPAFPSEFTDPNAAASFTIDGDGNDDTLALATEAVAGGASFETAGKGFGGISRAGNAQAAIGGHSDWYVNQVWIDPRPVDFGSIVGSKQITVALLSTYRYESRTLSDLDLSPIGGGVTILDNPLPFVFAPISELEITFEASVDGPPSFDANVGFPFDNRTLDVQFLGRRVILFWYPPDTGIRESLQWFTDAIRAYDGTEQRRSLRTTPRQRFVYPIRSRENTEASALRSLLLFFRAFTFGVPIWWEQRQVTAPLSSGGATIQVSTVDVDHRAGGTVFVWEPKLRSYFDAVIDSFDSTSITLSQATEVDVTADAVVMPVRFGYLAKEPEYDDEAFGALTTICEFETTDNVDLAFADQTALEAEFTVHPEDSLPIITDPILLDGAQRRKQSTRFTLIDNKIGVPEILSGDPVSELSQVFDVELESLSELRQWRAFAHWNRGSWRAFYLPTFRPDLIPTADFALNATSITIEAQGGADLFSIREPHASVMLELADGSQYFAGVDSITAGGAGEEIVSLINPFDASTAIVDKDVVRISWLELVRIDGDVVTFVHEWVGRARLRFNLKTVQQ